jgi:phospholipase C
MRAGAVTLLIVLGVAAGACASTSRPARSHVAVIVLENKSYDEVVGSAKAPYFNALARKYALATQFFGISHPSLPNYLALTGGSTFGITDNCTDCSVGATSIVDQLERAGASWKAYIQALPAPCSTAAKDGRYAKKHNPFMYYRGVAGDPARCNRIVPYSALAADLRRHRLPDFVWISPDLCDSTHDCGLPSGDGFLAGVVPALLKQLGPAGALFVTYDEGDPSAPGDCCRLAHGGHIATVIAGPGVKRGVKLNTPYDLYSILRTIDAALGQRPLRGAGCACTPSLDAAFRTPLAIGRVTR